MKNDIDCVILWVDGSDKKWKCKKNSYVKKPNTNQIDADADRYRDWGLLRYLFRGIDKFAPWFRYVFLVTDEQVPHWLNRSNKKIKMVDHKDFIPEKYLPTFNSHTIELNLHRIKELSEYFVYFNDDMFLIRKTDQRLFFRNNLPCDSAIMNAFAIKKTEKNFRFLMPINDIEIINAHFNKREVIKKYRWKFYNYKYGMEILRTFCLTPWRHFTGFTINHMPYSLCKSTFGKVWEAEPEILDRTCSHKFRNSSDVNIWLMQYWQYAEGNFCPRALKNGALMSLSDSKEETLETCEIVKKQKYAMCCINDDLHSSEKFEEMKRLIIEAFEQTFPEKSIYEL